MIERFVDWTLSHNLLLIEALILLIFISGFFLVIRELASRKSSQNRDAGGGASLDQIEQLFKDVVGKSGGTTMAATHETSGSGPDAAPLMEELQLLRQALTEKEKEMESLRAGQASGAPSSGEPAATGLGDAQALQKQIDDLQAKLREYDIISEDIADLTKFKTENEKLKTELSQLKGAAPAPAAEAEIPPASAAEAETPAASVEPLVTEEAPSAVPETSVVEAPPVVAESVTAEPVASADVAAEAPAIAPAVEASPPEQVVASEPNSQEKAS